MKKFVLPLALTVLCCILFVCAPAAGESYGCGYIDRSGAVVIEPQFDYAYPFAGDRARIFTGKLTSYGYPDEGFYGYIDRTGRVVIRALYENAGDFSENGFAIVCKNKKYGIIDTEGNTVVDFAYDDISYLESMDTYDAFTGTLTSWGSPESGTHRIITAAGEVLFTVSCKNIYAYDGYYEAYGQNEKYALVGPDGTFITDYIYDSLTAETADSIGYKTGSLYGFIDTRGNVLVEAAYDSVGRLTDGKAIVKKDGRYFLIDAGGTVLQSYQADSMSMSIVNGRTYAFEGTLNSYGNADQGYYYLMDLDGNSVSRKYRKGDCYSIDSAGTWRVKEGDSWYILDMQGNELGKPVVSDYLTTCGRGYYTPKKNGYYALMKEDGTLVTDYVWDNIYSTDDALIPVRRLAPEMDFRSTRWGMTEDEVKAVEGNNPDYSGRLDGRNAWYIAYERKLMGNGVLVAYYFSTNGLYEARYIWTEKHSNENLFISDYDSVRTQLTNKYGNPWWDHENWDTTSHKNYYADKKGDALSYGYLSYETCYSTARTDITMQMSADNYTVSFIIYYESKDIAAPAEDYSDLF